MKAHPKIKLASMLFVLALGLCCGPRGLEVWSYASADLIERAGMDTSKILKRYELSGDSAELRRWVKYGPTEGPGSEMHITLGRWSLDNKDRFLGILQDMSEKDHNEFLESFCPSLGQSGLWDGFKVAFQQENIPGIAPYLGTPE